MLVPVTPLSTVWETIAEVIFIFAINHFPSPCKNNEIGILPVGVDTVVEEGVSLGDLGQLQRGAVPQVGLQLHPGG